ncbi:hypothetical protein OHQ89_05540 [Streptomyces canus]|uniref:hypothetical protein n=1 Tax=Streptomyces canus TaxID=58343 RepID=UPI0030E2EBB5
MGPLLALASAVCYGIVVPQLSASLEPGGAPTTGGLLSRRVHFAAVTFLGQVGGLLLATSAALFLPADAVRPVDLRWGALSGVGSGAAMHFLNRGLSHGAMSVIVPVSAVTGVASPSCAECCSATGRPPWPWLGIVLSVPALRMVCGGGADDGAGVPDGLPASAGVALQYIALAQAGASSGLWPRDGWPPYSSRCPRRHERHKTLDARACRPYEPYKRCWSERTPSDSSSCSPPSGSCRPSPSSWPPSTRPSP